jgi:uncharacterized protein YjbI with pentapeptide repeats
LAQNIRSERSVVIKEWRRTECETPSLDYANYLPEIERLRQIDDPNVAPYIGSFETPQGFCVVRAFVPGSSLAEIGQLAAVDIKFLGDVLLKVLGRLHRLDPSVIHQNIKAENIIIDSEDDELRVYLVDFGLDADRQRLGGNAFTPAECLFVLDRTPTTDLHSLGLALICALTGTVTTRSECLFDDKYRLKFAHLLSERPDPYFNAWLETMVEQNRDRRKINTRSNRHRAYESVFINSPKHDDKSAKFTKHDSVKSSKNKVKHKRPWLKLLLPLGLLLGLGLLVRQLLWPESQLLWSSEAEEPSPEQIAKSQELAKKARYMSSDIGRLLGQKECNRCNFDRQNFAKAELTGANVANSTFNGTNLERANLSLAILSDADLTGTNLSNANLQKSAFYGAKFVNTNLTGANLSNAKLLYAKLKGVSLQNANLTNSDLKFTELQYVNLSNADLTGADLSNADLSFSNLRNAKLTGAKLDGAILTGTTMPDGKIRP